MTSQSANPSFSLRMLSTESFRNITRFPIITWHISSCNCTHMHTQVTQGFPPSAAGTLIHFFTCVESMTATIMLRSSPLRSVSSGNWTRTETRQSESLGCAISYHTICHTEMPYCDTIAIATACAYVPLSRDKPRHDWEWATQAQSIFQFCAAAAELL